MDTGIADYVSQKTQQFAEQRDSFFQDLQGDKIGSLKEAIEDIQELIVLRENLHKDIMNDIEKIKILINNFISELGDVNNRAEQLKMRQKQMDIEELFIEEKVNCWRDVAQLKRELRERVREYKERETRSSVLDKIFEQ